MTDTAKLASILAKALDSLPEDKRKEVTQKMENLFEKLAGAPEPKAREEREIEFMRMVHSNLHLGEMIYQVAMKNYDDPKDFDSLEAEQQIFWTLLAMRTNFNPDNCRCVCPGCMGESGEPLFVDGEEEESTEDDEGIFEMTGTSEDVERMLETRKLPPQVMDMLRARGIDPDTVNIEVVKLDPQRKH